MYVYKKSNNYLYYIQTHSINDQSGNFTIHKSFRIHEICATGKLRHGPATYSNIKRKRSKDEKEQIGAEI